MNEWTCERTFIGVKKTSYLLSHLSCVQLFVTLWTPPGSSVHGILQARILEWVAMPSSRGSSQPRDGTQVSHAPCIGSMFFTTLPPWLPVVSMLSHVSELLFMVKIHVHTQTQKHTPHFVYPFLW